jgi:anti-sigma B factor antagonist
MPTAQITTKVRNVADGIRVIDISGEITAFSEDALRIAHDQAAAGDVKVVILNFTDLSYMNSGGIGLIVTNLIRAQRAGHRLLAYGLTDHYLEIFSLTRLDEAIEIYDDETAAVEAA